MGLLSLQVQLPEEDIMEAISWIADRTPQEVRLYLSVKVCMSCKLNVQVNRDRQKIIEEIETVAGKLWSQGRCKEWLAHADPHIKQVKFVGFAEVCFFRIR